MVLTGSARGRVVGRRTGAGAAVAVAAVAGSAHGSTAVAAGRGCGARAGGGVGAADLTGGGASGRAGVGAADLTSVGAAGRAWVGAAGWAGVVCGADWTERAAGLGRAASVRAGAGAGVGAVAAFERAARAAELFGSKAGGSVGFLTWSADGVESVGPEVVEGAVFKAGEAALSLCA